MANLRACAALSTAPRTILGAAGLSPTFPSRRPDLAKLLDCALDSDPDVSAMACRELRERLDRLPATEQGASVQ